MGQSIIIDVTDSYKPSQPVHILTRKELTDKVKVLESEVEDIKNGSSGAPGTYDDTEIKNSINSLKSRIQELEESGDADTIYDDTEIINSLNSLESRIQELEESSDADTIYDDTVINSRVSNLNTRIGILEDIIDGIEVNTFKLTNVVDLTEYFAAANSETKVQTINEQIAINSPNNVLFVGKGKYYVNGTIMLPDSVRYFICLGEIVGPTSIEKLSPLSEMFTNKTIYRDEISRALVMANGSNMNVYIDKLTIRHNYAGFYMYYSANSNITINRISGEYSNYLGPGVSTGIVRYHSLFGNVTSADISKQSRTTYYKPILDSWLLNAGIMGVYLEDCKFNIGIIENLNYGIHFTNLIPKPVDSSFSGGTNIEYIAIELCEFNVKAIDCKKGVNIDLLKRIILDTETYETTYATSGFSTYSFVNGNRFNINSFDHYEGKQTNQIETCNDDFYDQSVDNRRIMFNIAGSASGNTFNSMYMQGVYDVAFNLKNTHANEFTGVLQVNDMLLAASSGRSQRHDFVTRTRYRKGTVDDILPIKEVNVGPIVIIDNCYDITINNIGNDFIRTNDEVSILNNSKKIFIKNMYTSTDTGTNYLPDYHSSTINSCTNVKSVIYNGNDVYYKMFADGFTLQS